MNKSLSTFLKEIQKHNIFTFDKFNELTVKKKFSDITEHLTEQEIMLLNYSKINAQRTSRILKTFKPNKNLATIIKEISEPQTWIAITEDWCGDSAQNLPYFYKYSELNPQISFSIILRDSNLELVDKYFTEGNPRSIPKVVGFDTNGEEIFIWGARPKVAQNLVMKLKNEGYSKEDFNKELHLWYSKNRGQELEKELIDLLK